MNGRVSIEGANQVSSGDSSVEFKEEEEGVIAVEEHLVIPETYMIKRVNRNLTMKMKGDFGFLLVGVWRGREGKEKLQVLKRKRFWGILKGYHLYHNGFFSFIEEKKNTSHRILLLLLLTIK